MPRVKTSTNKDCEFKVEPWQATKNATADEPSADHRIEFIAVKPPRSSASNPPPINNESAPRQIRAASSTPWISTGIQLGMHSAGTQPTHVRYQGRWCRSMPMRHMAWLQTCIPYHTNMY